MSEPFNTSKFIIMMSSGVQFKIIYVRQVTYSGTDPFFWFSKLDKEPEWLFVCSALVITDSTMSCSLQPLAPFLHLYSFSLSKLLISGCVYIFSVITDVNILYKVGKQVIALYFEGLSLYSLVCDTGK